jgi:O-antigen/teichoic acid export membrane protein
MNPVKNFLIQLLRAALSAVFVVLCSRWMGPEGRGELGLLLFWAGLLMVANDYVGGSNLANMLQRYKLNSLLPVCFGWALWTVAAAVAILWISQPSAKSGLMLGLISLPLVLLSIIYNMQQGLGMVQRRNGLQLLLEALKLVILAALFFKSRDMSLSVGTAVGALFYAMLVVLVIAIWQLRKHIFPAMLAPVKPPAELFSSGFWSQNGHLAQFLAYRLSLYTLTWFSGSHFQAGIYANALLIADTIWIFANSFGTIAHVRILRSSNSRFQADITLRYAVFALAGTTAACFALVWVPSHWFTAVFGPGFESLKPTVILLIPSILAVSASSLFSHYLHAVNRFKALFLANAGGLVLQTLLGVFLIPRLGIVGACISANAGFALVFLLVFLMFRQSNPGSRFQGTMRLKAMWRILKQSLG